MEDLGRLGPPQIKLQGLEIWIHGRQFPDAHDFWDGNWLRVTVHCGAPGADVLASGAIIHLWEVQRWHDAVAKMRDALIGEANLSCIEPNLSVELKINRLGQIAMQVEITPNHMTQRHSFEFDVDQTYLIPLLRQCRAVLDEYPARGEPAAR